MLHRNPGVKEKIIEKKKIKTKKKRKGEERKERKKESFQKFSEQLISYLNELCIEENYPQPACTCLP